MAHVDRRENSAFNYAVSQKAIELTEGVKQMPQAIDLEEAVLGALMLERNSINIVKPILKAEHFYKAEHQVIYKAIVELNNNGTPIDMLLIIAHLRKMGRLKDAGDILYLTELTNKVASSANLEYHALEVHEKYLRREAIHKLFEYQQRLFDPTNNTYELRNELSQIMRVQHYNSLMRVRDMNRVMEDAKNQPDLMMMAGALIRKTEVAFLFADTGVGKSIFGIQIADALSKGENLLSGVLVNEAGPQRVLYFDFELSDKQLEKRYKHEALDERYQFSENLLRADFNPKFLDFDQRLDKLVAEEIESLVEIHKPTVLFVDNITYLTAESSQDTQVAMDLMKRLRAFKVKYELTIIVLAHTPKRNKIMPITVNDMAGSKHLSNFAQSVFAIGESVNDPDTRYIKQLKASNGKVYDDNNVIVCEIMQDGMNHMLQYDFVRMGRERDFLADFADEDTQDDLVREAARLRNEENKSWPKIRAELNLPWTPRHLSRLVAQLNEGVVQHEFQKPGSASDSNTVAPKMNDDDDVPF